MLRYALASFSLSLLAGLFGFTRLFPAAAAFARILFVLLLLVSLGIVLAYVIRKG